MKKARMAMEILVPALGESVSEATVAQWLKQPGEAVNLDEPLVELETDKVTLEVNATAAGVLSEIVAGEGDNVEVGAILGRIAEGAAAAAAAAAEPPAPAPAKADSAPAPAEPPVSAPAPSAAKAPAAEALSPAVRKLIDDNRLDPGQITGTGKDGRIVKEDVLKALEGRGAPPPPAPAAPVAAPAAAPPAPSAEAGAREERVRMTRLRKRIAERLKEAQNTAAMLTTFNEVDMGAVMELRKTYRDDFEKKHGVRLGFMSFFTKASIAALKEIPAVNAEIDGDDLVYKNHYDIGMAVGTPREDHRRTGPPGARRQALHRRDDRRHLHHHQRRGLRLAAIDPDPQPAAVGHPGPAQDRGTSHGHRRRGQDPADDVSCAQLRSPHHRRARGGDVPGPAQGPYRGPAAPAARPLEQIRIDEPPKAILIDPDLL
jgi:2-oxoglutarate dehydrogenase E2 component (dihydrolipoamide succinyltransferase)